MRLAPFVATALIDSSIVEQRWLIDGCAEIGSLRVGQVQLGVRSDRKVGSPCGWLIRQARGFVTCSMSSSC